MKIFVASFNRASDGAISKLVERMKEEDMYTHTCYDADYIMAVGDRTETFDFVLREFRAGKPIIHLWSGEISQGTEDEVYRHAMTIMSKLQLCTNIQAEHCVRNLCKAIGKESNAHVIGNVMLDNMVVDEFDIPEKPYNLVLYNPPTLYTEKEVGDEVSYVDDISSGIDRIWVEPNGDKFSYLILDFVTHKSMPRAKFLGLIKNCEEFITNSSCAYYEAPFLMCEDDIIMVGERNRDRNSKVGMDIPNATENIISILRKELK